LPFAHEGGALVVRHGGQEVVPDWASAKPTAIQWTALFSNCEHEVLEVTKGHRVTLTYNLYWATCGPALMSNHLHMVHQPALHFYAALEKLFKCRDFLSQANPLCMKF
jgi:hypothetical protein